MLKKQKTGYSELNYNLNKFLLPTVLRKMTDAEFSTVAKLSLTNKKSFQHIINQKIIAELNNLIINMKKHL